MRLNMILNILFLVVVLLFPGITTRLSGSINDQKQSPKGSTTGELPTTATQDSAYNEAINNSLPPLTRLYIDLNESAALWEFERQLMEGKPWQIALKNLQSLPPDIFKPTENQIVQQQINIQQAFHVPFVQTYNPYGLKVSFSDIGRLLGLAEDVSPRIRYSLEKSSNVEVVIYSVQAIVIQTLFNGTQPPGEYELLWNGKNYNGADVPPGDYIAEVRIGKERYIRKRVVIQ